MSSLIGNFSNFSSISQIGNHRHCHKHSGIFGKILDKLHGHGDHCHKNHLHKNHFGPHHNHHNGHHGPNHHHPHNHRPGISDILRGHDHHNHGHQGHTGPLPNGKYTGLLIGPFYR